MLVARQARFFAPEIFLEENCGSAFARGQSDPGSETGEA
jgi:hypothetical protein